MWDCAERAVESDGWGGVGWGVGSGGWRCVVTSRERHDSFISFSLPQPPQRTNTRMGDGVRKMNSHGSFAPFVTQFTCEP